MSSQLFIAVGATLLCTAGGALAAQSQQRADADERRAEARLIAERASLTPGETAHIAITFTIDPKWHLYGPMQNETGGPPTFEFTLPEGYELGKPQWPAPQRSITDYGDGFKILDHIYEKELTVVFPLKVPADAEPGSTAIIAADLDWVVCSDTCIFESGEVRLELPVASPGSEAKRSPEAALLERARKRHARPLPQENPPVTIRLTDDAATIRAAGAAAVVFYPADDGVPLAGLIDRAKVKGDTVKLPIADYATAEQRKAPLRGMLEVRSEPDGAPTFWQIDHPPGAGG